MVGLPVTFPLPSETSIASYSWTDIANGAGYITFYGTTALNSTPTLTYSLITNAIEADEVITHQLKNNDETYTFDVSFNTPRILKGDCFAVVPIYAKGAAGNELTTTANLSLYHYDGTTETQIGSTVTGSIEGGDTYTWKTFCSIIEPSAEVSFKIGDILRFKVNLVTDNAGSRGGFSHDPTNSSYGDPYAGEERTRILSLHIPFKIDL